MQSLRFSSVLGGSVFHRTVKFRASYELGELPYAEAPG